MRGGPLARRRTAVTAALVLAVAAGVAVASSLRGSGGPSTGARAATHATVDTDGLTLFAPGTASALAPDDPRQLPRPRPGAFHGRLLYTDERCRLRVIDLATGREVALPGSGAVDGCSFWPSANGRYVAFAAAPLQADVALVELRSGRVRRGLRLGGTGVGSPAVTDDGRLAVCVQGAISAVTPATAHVEVTGIAGSRPRQTGCHPVALGGRLARIGATGDVVSEDGRRLVRFGSADDVAGLAASADGRRLGVLLRSATGVMVMRTYDTSGRRIGTLRNVGRGDILFEAGVADDGSVAVTSTPFGWQASTAAANTIAIGSKLMLGATVAPDGRAVAAVTPDAIVFLRPPTLRPVAALPVIATRVVWLR